MKKSILRLLIGAVLFTISCNAYSQWTLTNGPYGGVTNSIVAMGPSIFAGTQGGGVFISNNQGGTWTTSNAGLTNLQIWTLAINGSDLFAGTANGLFRSSDNGTSWSEAGNLGYVTSITNDGGILYVASSGSIHISTDGGTSWSLFSDVTDVYSIAVSGTNLVSISAGHGIYLTPKLGGSSTLVLPDNDNTIVTSLGNVIYANNGPSGTQLVRSLDGGLTWSVLHDFQITPNFISIFNGYLYVGTPGGGLWLSSDGGTNWSSLSSGMLNYSVRSLQLVGAKMFAGTGDGVYVSQDYGATWARSTNGMNVAYILGLGLLDNQLAVGILGPTVTSPDNGETFIPTSTSSLPYFARVIIQVNSTWLIASGSEISRSTNHGQSWDTFYVPVEFTSFTLSGSAVFATTPGSGVYQSLDEGATWSPSGLSGLNVTSLTVKGDNLFASTEGSGVFLSTDNGSTWSPVNSGLFGLHVLSLTSYGNKIFAGTLYGMGVFMSDNNGASWTSVNTDLPTSYIYTLAIAGGKIFANTSNGIYSSDTTNIAWSFEGLKSVEIDHFFVNEGKIFASTPSGLYQRAISKADQAITFDPLSTVSYGSAAFDPGAIASSGLGVTYVSSNTGVAVITDNKVTIVGAGTAAITASQTGNLYYNPAPDVTQTLTVTKADQTITFNPLATVSYGSAAFDLMATSSSGLAITYASSNTNVAVIVNNKVTVVGVGDAVITASQTGDSNFNPASDVSQTLTVTKADQTITFNPIPPLPINNADINLNDFASVNSGLSLTYASSNTDVATVLNGLLTIHGIGTAMITAQQPGDDNYAPAEPVQQVLTVFSKVIGISSPQVVNDTLAFGNVIVGETKTLNFTISNTGNDVLTISSITFPSGFSGDKASGTIPADGTLDVSVVFSPSGPTLYKSTVTIVSDATSGKSELAVSGVGENITAIEAPNVALSVYPNPGDGVYIVEGADYLSKTNVQVVDNTGQYVQNFNVTAIDSNKYQLDITTSSTGLYSILIQGQKAVRIIKH